MLLNLLKTQQKPNGVRIVVALNQVDKMVKNGWDEKLNAPTREAEKEIARRCEDIIKKFGKYSEVNLDQLEYYSGLKRYRLLPLLSKVIKNTFAGFKFGDVKPADPFGLADKEVQDFIAQEREKREKEKRQKDGDDLFSELKKMLSPEDLETIKSKFAAETKIPPKVAILGKAGVGKTTTVNNLFNVEWKTSPTTVGTTEEQSKVCKLESGGELDVVDLPGYGRSIAEDKKYQKIYNDIIPTCDLVLLVLQADTRDFTDDQEMLQQLIKLLKQPVKR